jgi:hypothetical protein
MKEKSLFARPRTINNLKDCYFYHTLDIPGCGTIEGDWDLREGITECLGGVDFNGKRVLEIGTASGALCFEMEKAGASVIAFDLSKEYGWDIVPHPGINCEGKRQSRKMATDRLNNAFWFCHQAFNSRAKMVHGNLYNIPEEIGTVDIVTFGAILLHVRDPFLALQTGLKFALETVIITELLGSSDADEDTHLPVMKFLPDPKVPLQHNAWWQLYPNVITRMIGLLGFQDVSINYHFQKFRGSKKKMFTVVGKRTNASGLPG